MSQTPEHPSDVTENAETPETEVFESDPSADSADGLSGGMGVSSERTGTVRGSSEEVTYGAGATHPDADEVGAPTKDLPPEQSAYDDRPEINPDPLEPHTHDRDRSPRHGV